MNYLRIGLLPSHFFPFQSPYPQPFLRHSIKRCLCFPVLLCQCSVPEMISGAKHTKGAKRNSTLLVSFVKCFGTPEFLMSLKLGSLDLKDILCWAHTCTIVPMRATVSVLMGKSYRRTFEPLTTGFAVNEDRCCESSVQRKCSRFCVLHYFCSCTLNATCTFWTCSSACPETGMSPFGF